MQHDRKFDIEFQKKLENVAFKNCAVNLFCKMKHFMILKTGSELLKSLLEKTSRAEGIKSEIETAHIEMKVINYEKQQLVHQWTQILMSLEKQDKVLSEIRNSVMSFEHETLVLQTEVTSHKKSVRKELERNKKLSITLHY